MDLKHQEIPVIQFSFTYHVRFPQTVIHLIISIPLMWNTSHDSNAYDKNILTTDADSEILIIMSARIIIFTRKIRSFRVR